MTTKLNKKNCIFTNPLFLIPFILACIGVLGVVIGAICDWQISLALAGHKNDAAWYDTNGGVTTTWAWYMSGLPGIFASLLLSSSCMLLLTSGFFLVKEWNKVLRIVLLVVAYLVSFVILTWWAQDSFIGQIYEAYLPGANPVDVTGIHTGTPKIDATYNKYALAAIVAVLEMGLFSALAFTSKFVKNNALTISKCALFAILLIFISQLFVLEMKNYFPRARFFQIVRVYSNIFPNDSTDVYNCGFRPVYSMFWNYNTKEITNLTDGISYGVGDMTSWPSGHETWSMMLLGTLPFIGLINTKNAKTNTALKFSLISLVGLFIVLIMFARIVAGRHYLSDVTTAICFSTLIAGLIAIPTFKLIPLEKSKLVIYILLVAIILIVMLFVPIQIKRQ